MEALAYTWFNRLVAIRFMELHGYLDHGYRVLSHPEGKSAPEILEHAEHVELPGLKKEAVIDLKLAGNKESELYRTILIAQCNALHSAMPFLFEKIEDETELLLPDNLLHSDSLIRKLVEEIEEEDWQEVEIIGWLYQFYISEKKDQVIGKVVASEDIPAATNSSHLTGPSSTSSRTPLVGNGWLLIRTHRSGSRWNFTLSLPSRRQKCRSNSRQSRRPV